MGPARHGHKVVHQPKPRKPSYRTFAGAEGATRPAAGGGCEDSVAVREQDVVIPEVEDGRRIAWHMQPSEFDAEVLDLLDIIRSAVHAADEPDA